MTAFSAVESSDSDCRSAEPREPAVPSCDLAIELLQRFASSANGVLDGAEQAAMSLLYVRYSGMVRGVVARILGPTDAEDILHDVFARLPWLICQYGHGGFGGWLRQVATRSALMRLRRSSRIDLVSRVPDRPVEAADSVEDREQLSRAVDRLAPSLREVVVLRFFHDLSHEQIGERLGITRNASEVRLCRALKQLRTLLRTLSEATPAERATSERTPPERVPRALLAAG